MSDQPIPADFDRLEEKAVRYAIAAQARDAIHTQLKYWAAVAAVLGGAAGWLGFSLHSKVHDLRDGLAEQMRVAEELERKTAALSTSLTAREVQIARLASLLETRQHELVARTDRLFDNTARISEKAAQFDAESRLTLRQLHEAAELAARRAAAVETDLSRISNVKREVEATAGEARDSVNGLRTIMSRAQEFDASIEGQRQVFRNALLDYVTLTRNAQSPELVLSTADARLHYRVVFRTPSEIRKDGFTLSYGVLVCRGERAASAMACTDIVAQSQHDKVIKFVRNRRDWHELEGTDGRYRFAVDYIFTAKLARNYVTVRVGATDQLLPDARPQTPVVAAGQ